MDALKIISEGSIKAEKPQFNVGDTVRVDVRMKFPSVPMTEPRTFRISVPARSLRKVKPRDVP